MIKVEALRVIANHEIHRKSQANWLLRVHDNGIHIATEGPTEGAHNEDAEGCAEGL